MESKFLMALHALPLKEKLRYTNVARLFATARNLYSHEPEAMDLRDFLNSATSYPWIVTHVVDINSFVELINEAQYLDKQTSTPASSVSTFARVLHGKSIGSWQLSIVALGAVAVLALCTIIATVYGFTMLKPTQTVNHTLLNTRGVCVISELSGNVARIRFEHHYNDGVTATEDSGISLTKQNTMYENLFPGIPGYGWSGSVWTRIPTGVSGSLPNCK